MFSVVVLQKVILGGLVVVVIIITVIGLSVGLNYSEKLDNDDQSINQKPYVPKHITLELSDGINMGEAGP